MPRRILGIDIGSSSVKFAQLSKTFKGVSTAKFFQQPLPHLGDDKPADSVPSIEETITQIIKNTIEEKNLVSDEYLTCLPSKLIMMREVNLPFKETSKIRQVIKFEIEQLIPFSPDEVIVDFLMNGNNSNSSLVTAFCLNKRNLSNHLSILNAAGIEPRLITIDSFPILGVLKSSSYNMEGVIAFIEIGARNAVINIYNDGNFVFNRSISNAGNFITKKIMDHLKISFEEAEMLKKEPDIDLTNPGLSETTKIVANALDEISKDIAYSINSFQTKKGGYSINKILLSGGTSCIKGISEFLQSRLNSEVSLFTPKLSFEVSEMEGEQSSFSPLFNLSLGLATLEINDKIKRINLRREEYSFKLIDKRLKVNFKYAGVLLGVILFFSLFNMTFDFFQKRKENKELEKKIISICREMIPSGTLVNPSVQAIQHLEKVKTEFSKFQQIAEIKSTPLDVLKELSNIIPKDFTVKISNFSLKGQKLEINGEAASLEAVDKLEKMLKTSSLFKDIKISNIQMNKVQNVAEFTLNMKID